MYNNVQYDTFKAACVVRGLLEDDEGWAQCLQEASVMKSRYQLRRLFALIMTQCSPIQPDQLWNNFSMSICDDLPHKLRTNFEISNPTDDQMKDYGLHLLNEILQESGKGLEDFPPIPLPTQNWNGVVGNNRLLWEHRQLQYDTRTTCAEQNINRLNDDQRHSFEAVMSFVLHNQGKTFLYNTIAGKCRSMGHIMICVESSGIASLMLVGGRTAHSMFCIPIDVLPDTICSFTKQSIHAELFREAKPIIWDEVLMQNPHCVETVDHSLQDVRGNYKPFGGITVVLGGDFPQTRPLYRKDTVSKLWDQHFEIDHLGGNTHIDFIGKHAPNSK